MIASCAPTQQLTVTPTALPDLHEEVGIIDWWSVVLYRLTFKVVYFLLFNGYFLLAISNSSFQPFLLLLGESNVG